MKRLSLTLTVIIFATAISIGQQKQTTEQKASKKGEKKSMTSKHDPSMSKRTEIKNPQSTAK